MQSRSILEKFLNLPWTASNAEELAICSTLHASSPADLKFQVLITILGVGLV